ncbi:(2Fe-2S)-binding protein [Streptomyces sp. BE303]|uniref:(2Fe-2S)-binding protein n=1 Tax=Streptomyces sp. BE303 TaxID=3002528 RepID=UPI002E75FBFE|nr:(2Fe-2S)-binding protein [Streptomyces sp. BE303]MED7951919.1 (2Fe-2S)-binding protein [Streptomyces sp. BE303]
MIFSGTSAPAAIACARNPLDAAYQRLLNLCPALRVRLLAAGEPTPARAQGWYSAAELGTDPAALADALDGEAARIAPLAAERGATAPRPHVAASRLLHHYLWSVCVLIAGPWQLARRVPSIGGTDLWLHAPTGDLVLRPRAHVTLEGEDELRAELRAAVVGHVEPLLAAFAAPTRRGTRALWGMVTDDLASAIWYLGRMLDAEPPTGVVAADPAASGHSLSGHPVSEAGSAAAPADVVPAVVAPAVVAPVGIGPGEATAVAAAGAVLPGRTEPLPGAADFRLLRGADGRAHHTRTRLGCCLYYAIEPGNACLTCPRTSDEERLRRL